MEIVQVKITDLKPAEYNPRQLTKDQHKHLTESIKRFGLVDPIIVNKHPDRLNVVIGGHQRLKIAAELNLKKIPVVYIELELEKEKELNLRLNKNLGEWDFDAMANNFDPEFLFDIGFSEHDLKFNPYPDEEKDDEVPEIPDEPKSKYGEIYQLGQHRLMCGDATKKEDVEKLMDGKNADIVFTSPPYNAGNNALGGNKNKIDNRYETYDDKKSQSDWKDLINQSLHIWRNHSTYQFYNIQQLAGNKKSFWEFIYENVEYLADVAIWNKGSGQPAMAKNVMNSRYEYIFIFSREKEPSRAINTANFRGKVSNVVEIKRDEHNKNSKIHAATFPVSFPTYFIKNFTGINNIVADSFIGVGSTLISCEKTGRICYGMELDPKYCDVIRKRYEEYTKGK